MKALFKLSNLQRLRRLGLGLALCALFGIFFAVPLHTSSASAMGWSPLAKGGLNGDVHGIAFVGDEMYVTGYFATTADFSGPGMLYIGRYNTVTHEWSSLSHGGLWGGGTPGGMVVVGTDLYVTGYFERTADDAVKGLNNMAKYDTVTDTWSALPNGGLNGTSGPAVVQGDNLYVGGYFSQTFDGKVKGLNRIAVFNLKTNTWSALPNAGLDNTVTSLAISGSTLYVGGRFHQTFDGNVTNLNSIAKFDLNTNTWSALPHGGLNGELGPMTVSNGILYVGGGFGQTADGQVGLSQFLAKFDTARDTWSAVPNGGLGSSPVTLQVHQGALYVGGFFMSTADGAIALNFIGSLDLNANQWSPLANGGLAWIGNVYAIAEHGDDIYMGGQFRQTNDHTIVLSYIAKYGPKESNPPTIKLTKTGTNASGHKFIEMTTRDGESGITKIKVLRSDNANTVIPPFVAGTKDPIRIVSTKIDAAKQSVVSIRVTDVVGNATVGDPVLQLLTITKGKRIKQTFKNIPVEEHYINIANGDTGLKRLRVKVNGKLFEVVELDKGEAKTLDAASAMVEGANKITLVGFGKLGASAFIIIGDSPMDDSSVLEGFIQSQKESPAENFSWGE